MDRRGGQEAFRPAHRGPHLRMLDRQRAACGGPLGGGASFGGILAFLYADLIVLPLLDVYRRYLGLEMAALAGR